MFGGALLRRSILERSRSPFMGTIPVSIEQDTDLFFVPPWTGNATGYERGSMRAGAHL